MALTATELVRLRQLTGGVVGTSEKDYLTDTQLQAEYSAASENFDTTVVAVLRLRVGMTAAFVDGSYGVETTSESLSQRHRHLKDLLTFWEGRTGLGGSGLSTGMLGLALDAEADDV